MRRAFFRCGGYTLVELLVVTGLSALLMVAMLQAYLSGKSVLRWQSASARLDVDGLRALEILTRDIRMSGFFGGAEAARIVVPDDAPDCGDRRRWALAPAQLGHIRAGRHPAADNHFGCLPLAALDDRSDIMAIKRVAGGPSWGPGSEWHGRRPEATQWYLGVDEYARGRFLWVGDGVPRSPDDVDRVSYWAFRARIYYIRRYSVRPDDRIPTLCVERLMGRGLRSECLVEGVEGMRFEFALDADGDGFADTLTDAPSEADLANTTHVMVYLLLRSLESPGVVHGAAEIRLGPGAVPVTDDGLLRRSFSATVPVMNRPGGV